MTSPVTRRRTPGPHLPRRLGLILGPLAFTAVLAAPAPAGLAPAAVRAAATTLWMAIWWVTEAVPIPATSLLPLVLLPATGALPPAAAAAGYANPLIFLFMGGFMMALSLERWAVHRHLAVFILSLMGGDPRRLTLGFMAATAFLSMWISNTASTMLMVPIAMAVVAHLPSSAPNGGPAASGNDPGRQPGQRFSTGLMLGIAYASSIGGIATLIGTPPNIILAAAVQSLTGVEISFFRWLLFAAPPAALALGLVWLYLTRFAFPTGTDLGVAPQLTRLLRAERERLGPLNRPQRAVLTIFALVALAWITRPWLIAPFLPQVDDAAIALAGALLLFAIPARLAGDEFLLDWQTAVRLPWDVVLLFGGGLTIAESFTRTGLADWIGASLQILASLPALLTMVLIVALVILLTEITSNTAITSMLMPVLAGLAPAVGLHPVMLMVPGAVAASCGFMLPVGTPPNAIIFGTGHVTIPVMARTGLWLNLASIPYIAIISYLLLPLLGAAR